MAGYGGEQGESSNSKLGLLLGHVEHVEDLVLNGPSLGGKESELGRAKRQESGPDQILCPFPPLEPRPLNIVDSFLFEIEANQASQSCGSLSMVDSAEVAKEEVHVSYQSQNLLRISEGKEKAYYDAGPDIEGAGIENQENSGLQLILVEQSQHWPIEDVQPLDIQIQMAELEASLWVHRNAMKLSKQFGVDFQGCEWEAWSLFMKLDKKRHENLQFGIKFKESGSRSRGTNNSTSS
nr:uncharacterized protein LOC117277981 isoform X1 [Nicotiana tomentosiformis]XP_033513310.1 uncharacterized protein LOC117277981 isoform X2 [Nicotiana tomentosiformis]